MQCETEGVKKRHYPSYFYNPTLKPERLQVISKGEHIAVNASVGGVKMLCFCNQVNKSVTKATQTENSTPTGESEAK